MMIWVSDESDAASSDSFQLWEDLGDIPFLEEHHPFMQAKPQILETILKAFASWEQRVCAPGPSAAQDKNSIPASHDGRVSKSRSKRGRTTNQAGDTGRNDEDEEEGEKKRPWRSEGPRLGRAWLACPFYKKDPVKYRHCHGRVISTIAHLKQHFTRSHQLPIYCPICKELFENEATRDTHSQLLSCQPRTDIIHEGLTTDQKRQLGRRAPSSLSEEGQWFWVFDILFPRFQPRPRSAYINIELSAEMENFQDFLPLEGPRVILSEMARLGIQLSTDSMNVEHDLGTFLEIVLSDALINIARQWNDGRLVNRSNAQGTDHEEPVDQSAVGSQALPDNMLENLPSLSTASMITPSLQHYEAGQVGANLANFINEQGFEDSGQEHRDAIRQPNMTHAGVNQSATPQATGSFSELTQNLEYSTADFNEDMAFIDGESWEGLSRDI
jgi:hypothetical protein